MHSVSSSVFNLSQTFNNFVGFLGHLKVCKIIFKLFFYFGLQTSLFSDFSISDSVLQTLLFVGVLQVFKVLGFFADLHFSLDSISRGFSELLQLSSDSFNYVNC